MAATQTNGQSCLAGSHDTAPSPLIDTGRTKAAHTTPRFTSLPAWRPPKQVRGASGNMARPPGSDHTHLLAAAPGQAALGRDVQQAGARVERQWAWPAAVPGCRAPAARHYLLRRPGSGTQRVPRGSTPRRMYVSRASAVFGSRGVQTRRTHQQRGAGPSAVERIRSAEIPRPAGEVEPCCCSAREAEPIRQGMGTSPRSEAV